MRFLWDGTVVVLGVLIYLLIPVNIRILLESPFTCLVRSCALFFFFLQLLLVGWFRNLSVLNIKMMTRPFLALILLNRVYTLAVKNLRVFQKFMKMMRRSVASFFYLLGWLHYYFFKQVPMGLYVISSSKLNRHKRPLLWFCAL